MLDPNRVCVLLVEDTDDMRAQVGGLLIDAGYQVDAVSSKAEAEAKLNSRRYSLAVLDVNLDANDFNNTDGVTLARYIRHSFSAMKIVILTAYATKSLVKQAAFEEGYADGFVERDEVLLKFLSTIQKLQPPRLYLGKGRKHAVLVGVDHFEDDRNYPRLYSCCNDATSLMDCLLRGGYETNEIELLVNASSNLILDKLVDFSGKAVEDDLLLFFFSGHGDVINKKSYLVAKDSFRRSLQHTGVSMEDMQKIMADSPARAKVIIIDACHSGIDPQNLMAKAMSRDFMVQVFEQAEGMAVLSSCQQGEYSYAWNSTERSVFTYFMIDALQGKADFERKGFVTVQDANRYVVAAVKQWADDNGKQQTPSADLRVSGDIILTSQAFDRG